MCFCQFFFDRSLEVLYLKGKKHSELLEEQQSEGGSASGGGLRFRNALIFRLECEKVIYSCL